jgi:hypothetical protein
MTIFSLLFMNANSNTVQRPFGGGGGGGGGGGSHTIIITSEK